MGFFQHETWLVSNAHVIRHRTEIDSGIILRQYDTSEVLLEAEQAYHRPWENVVSPDIVVLKTPSTHKNIPSNPLSRDATYQESHYFYIDAQFEIHYLSPVASMSTLPMLFRCQDGSSPQPGCSGTPIFSAKVIIGKIPSWKFEVVGALYARCLDPIPSELSQKLVCGVPIVGEFEQIRQILISLDSAAHHAKKAKCSMTIKDVDQAQTSQNLSERAAALAEAGIRAFEVGDSFVEIALPEGLEKLDGSGFYKLEQSHLALDSSEIQQTFFEFIEHIKRQSSIRIDVEKETTLLSLEHWRLDCKPGTGGQYWLLQVQDNTGKKNKINGKSASSIFAEVKIPTSVHVINGEPLAEDLLISRTNVEKGERHPSVAVVFENTIKSKKYRLTERRAGSPTLFHALNLSHTTGHDLILKAVHASEIERLNSIDENGDTPLMVLLQKKLTDPGQRKKAQLLAQCSIWNQANKNNKTAEELLEGRTDNLKNELF
ncbi:MAG: hypothetical protein CK424_07030 [Legionella sp.]|nr:MAG: hypothetical protein CK424_07030 [Legionella sp.]